MLFNCHFSKYPVKSLRTVPTIDLLLRICSAHREILGFPMGGAYEYRNIFARFKTICKKQNLPNAFGISKENWRVTMHFSEIIKLQFRKKSHTLLIFRRFLEILLLNYL